MKPRIAVMLLSVTAAGQDENLLSLAAHIELPNVSGRIDHFSADLKGGRVFVAALGNHSIEVLDVNSGKLVRSLPGLEEPQGLYFDAATNRLFAACRKDGAVKIYDGTSLQPLATATFSG